MDEFISSEADEGGRPRGLPIGCLRLWAWDDIIISRLLAWLVSVVSATALTYKIGANERACFFAAPHKQGQKIAFYFAVQSGGSFDIDYEVTGPTDKVVLNGEKERQGDFVFTANEVGDYKFCFNNAMSTYSEKFVDFEIAVEDEVRAQLPAKQGSSPEQTSALEDTVRSTEGRIVNFSLIQIIMVIAMGGLQVFVVRFFFQGARKGYV
ncbi:emp24/gp25L/p24 family/GOLD-domain-containing protein [Astrocystis sublimbata]|nr:emp24/gp25L/p24 family/GOLD-domain-containing protein [Astrocystis sublimbata]